MTLRVATKSHGIIECGFYEAFMKLSRIGRYCFETKDLCNLAQNPAENPELKEVIIFGYDISKFWELERSYTPVFRNKRIEDLLRGEDTTGDFFKKNRELSIEEKMELMEDKIEVHVTLDESEKIVKIGEYEIENFRFAQMFYYIAHGGYIGWNKFAPDFAKSALSAINASRSPLYRT